MLPWRHPAENIRLAAHLLRCESPPPAGREELVEQFGRLVQTMLDRGMNLHHPRYIGHQVAASLPLAGLLDAVGSITNQAMAIYDMGPWATAAEWAMVNELGTASAGPKATFAGLATHGGSLANLTALLTARNVALADCWQQGTARSGPPPTLVVHADAHYSVARTAGILGLGTRQVVRVGLDPRRRMDPQKLDDTLGDLKRRGPPHRGRERLRLLDADRGLRPTGRRGRRLPAARRVAARRCGPRRGGLPQPAASRISWRDSIGPTA